MLLRALDRFFSNEAAGGILLMLSALAALLVANSSLYPVYESWLNSTLAITLEGDGLSKALILWINDGLMAIFFLLVGLELKRELLEGRLKNPRDVVLPGAAAAGGMVLPALFFLAFNWGNAETVNGWAIPAATDIAFAVGILALVGDRVPSSLRIFLLTLAILDDLGAIIIIALFYTAELSVDYLALAAIPLVGMFFLNRAGIHKTGPIILLGVIMWVFVLKSGVHATLAGVITAFFVPLKDRWGASPLHSMEDRLTPYVFYLIVPLFAFANAGVVLEGVSLSNLLDPLPLGIAVGLFFGKQIGVAGVTWLMVRLGLARRPYGATWLQIYGIACLAGIGFTMSLFIGGLSYTSNFYMNEVRIGVLLGSGLSALVGYLVLRFTPSEAVETAEVDAKGLAERQEELEARTGHGTAH